MLAEQKLELVEFALALAAPNYDPSLLNPSFLNFSNIIPSEWEIARQPIVSQRGSEILYNNGISLLAEPNRLSLVEALSSKVEKSLGISEIAQRYILALPNLDATAIGLNFRGFVKFAGSTLAARDYLFKHFLVPGAWQQVGEAPVRAGFNFSYTIESKRLNLSLNEAMLETPEGEKVAMILFNGNFDYKLSGESLSTRRSQLQEIVNNWQADRETYISVVNKFIFSENTSELVFPALDRDPALS